MATTKAVNANAVKNDGGTATAAGTLSSDSPMTKVLNTKDLATNKPYGSKVIADTPTGMPYNDPHGVTTAKSGGTGGLAYFPKSQAGERNFIMLGAGDSASKINNDSVTVLGVIAADRPRDDDNLIAKRLSNVRIGAYSSTSYNLYATPSSGVLPGRTKGASAGSALNFVATSGNFPATDDAASPTRSVPGELTYMFGGKNPKQDDYKSKSTYES